MARVAGKKRRKLVTRLIERDGAACIWCSRLLNAGEATIDHLIPYRQGGSNMIENAVIACAGCNGMRGAKSVKKFRRECIQRGLEVRNETLAAARERMGLPHVRRATIAQAHTLKTKHQRRAAFLRLEQTRLRHERREQALHRLDVAPVGSPLAA